MWRKQNQNFLTFPFLLGGVVWGSYQKNERKFWVCRASLSEPRRAEVGVSTRSAREMLCRVTTRMARVQMFRSKWVRAKDKISPQI